MGELRHEKEGGKYEDVVNPECKVEAELAPWPFSKFFIVFFDGLLPRRSDGRWSDHKSQVSAFRGPGVVG